MFAKLCLKVLCMLFPLCTVFVFCCKPKQKENGALKSRTLPKNRSSSQSVMKQQVDEKKSRPILNNRKALGVPPGSVVKPTGKSGKSQKAAAKNNEVPKKDAKPPAEPEKHQESGMEKSNFQIMNPSDFLPLDKTVYASIYNPTVHERALKVAEQGLIVDPKKTAYGGNTDNANERERKQRFEKFAEELAKGDGLTTEGSSKLNSKKSKKPPGKVTIREDKCILFETNEVPTEDDEENTNNNEIT